MYINPENKIMSTEVRAGLIVLVLLASVTKIVVLVSTYRLKLHIWKQHQAELHKVKRKIETQHEAQIAEHMRLFAAREMENPKQ